MRAPQGIYPSEWMGKNSPHYKATGEYRPPKAGEFYLSGAIVQAYRAPNDYTSPCWIAKPIELVTCPRCQGKGKVEK